MRKGGSILHTGAPADDHEYFARIRSAEILRQALRRELRLYGSERARARDVGIDRNMLRRFVSGESVPRLRALERIRDWASDRSEPRIPLAQVALALLVDDLRPPARPGARRRVAAALAECFHESGDGAPTWVLDELAAGEAPAPAAAPATRAEQTLARIRALLDGTGAADPAAGEEE
jgi:hypothetical protein